MVYSPKLTFVDNSNKLTRIGLAPGDTIWLGILEFTAYRFGNLSLSPEENDSDVVFIGMVHSGPSSMHTIHEESPNEGDTASGRGGSFGLPDHRGCNVVTLIVPITATPLPEDAPALQTISMVPLQTTTPQPGTRLLPEQQQAY
jgi:hypothetical protein